MSALVINSVTYNGSPAAPTNPFPPSKIEMTIAKIGKTLTNANGGRSLVIRTSGGLPIRKRTWELSWANASTVTRNAVRALVALATTFTYTDEEGTSYTVQVEEDDPYKHGPSWTKSDASLLYDLSITLREA